MSQRTVNPPYVIQGSMKAKLQERLKWTPDFDVWRNFHSFPVFITDELKSGFTFDGHMEGAILIGSGLTIHPGFDMKISANNRPLIYKQAVTEAFSAMVLGELWMINVEHLHNLDRYYKNGLEFERIDHNVWLFNKDPEVDTGLFFNFFKGYPYYKSFMYVARPEYWNKTSHLRPKALKVGGDHESLHPILRKERYYEWDFMDEQNVFSQWGRNGRGDGLADRDTDGWGQFMMDAPIG